MSDLQKVLGILLKGKRLKQPFVYDPYKVNFKDDLQERFDNYLNRIRSMKASGGEIETYLCERLAELEQVTKIIMVSLDKYLSGNAGQAYDDFEKLMRLPIVRENISKIIYTLPSLLSKASINSDMQKNLYRVRCSDTALLKRREMFHIPFDSRHLVGAQRYSIAGLPCLYLGTSIYVCWQEMGKPDLNKMYISRYKYQEEQSDRIINFAYSLETLKYAENSIESFTGSCDEGNLESEVAYLVMYPLLIACSYNRAFTGSSFNVEYIIPNLFLQWISSEKSSVSGISYYSTKTFQVRNSTIGMNFVFPPSRESLKLSGVCEKLGRSFHLSQPMSWQLLDTMGEGSFVKTTSLYTNTSNIDEYFVKNYKSTKFYRMEKILESFQVQEVNEE